MTASDAMRGLFKAIGDYVRPTSTPNAGRPPVVDLDEIAARVAFRRHGDGTGFTIDGSKRPGDPTRPGEQNSGAFLGLQSGHAIQSVKAWAKRAGYLDEDIDRFDRLDDLLEFIRTNSPGY